MRKLFFCLLLISYTFGLFSYSLYENYELELGRQISVLDARSSAMGGTGTSSGINVLDSITNPANIGFLNRGLNIQLMSNLVHLEENRSLPMFNFFDSYVDDATYASNTNIWHEMAFGVSYLHSLNDLSFAAAVNYRPFLSFKGYYEEQVRNNEGSDNDNYPPIIAMNYIDSDGDIYAFGFNGSVVYTRNHDLFSKSAVGFSLNMLSGKHEQEKKILWSEWAHQQSVLEDVYHEQKHEYDGISIDLGLRTDITSRIAAGIMFSPSFTMNGEDKLNNLEYEYDYPMNARIGFQYRPRNILRTTLTFDVAYVQWSDVSSFFEDSFNYYFGVEHIFPHAVPLRLGFNYVTSPSLKDRDGFTIPGPIVSPAITAGTGFNIMNNLVLDIGGEFNHRKYEAMDIFPDGFYDRQGLWTGGFSPQNRNEPDTVREYILNLKSTLTYKW
jgi:hypothetical protein